MTLQVLMDNSPVEELLIREEQSDMIEKVFKKYESEESISINLVLIGVTGAGKTFTLNQIISKYPNHIYISAATKKKSNQIISLISGINVRRTDILLEKTIDFLKKSKKVLIVDELNRIQDPRTFFDDMNTIFRETNIPIIVITNNPLVVDNMEEDARNTLFLKKVIFTKYTTLDLKEICLQRIKLLPGDLPGKIGDGVLNYICALAARAGSARKALNLVRGCYIDKKFDMKHVASLEEQEEILDFKTFINSMNQMQRKFLEDMFHLSCKAHREGEEFISYKDLQEKIPGLNKSRISQLVTEFENNYGFIETKYVEKGRGGGRYREIKFVNEEILDKLDEVFG